ncbi:propionyl-coenzyme A carboxylase alpha polypeptide [Mesorhizobium loti R88b]|uniref:Propionyl-coenzyme A carboxylase alpha polypeptide n=1 Tax=Mesorhizobium loti R88b TaxID=935548 RepID=A0A6M7WMN6_RHILI|nr:propionyl-coenzyme A carboxylase alpha polypeptide [Mesorhizobium loti R88b]
MRSVSPPSGLPAISPSRGEIGCGVACANLQCLRMSATPRLLISPLEGEMPGRAEGGTS